jgi:DNA-binding transcriptional ArsR family regulator
VKQSQQREETTRAELTTDQPPGSAAARAKRSRSPAYTQIPNEAAIAGFKALGCPQAFVWQYIHYRVWAELSRTVVLPSQTLAAAGVSRQVKYRALARLERAGLIKVEKRGKRSPLVTLL